MRKEEGKNWWSIIGALFIVFIFVGSTIGFIFVRTDNSGGDGATYDYNGLKFTQVQGGWQAETTLGIITTMNLPQQTKEVIVEDELQLQALQAPKTYVIAETSEEVNAATEILRNIPFNQASQACLPEQGEDERCKDLPLKNCEDARIDVRIIILEEKVLEQEIDGFSSLATERVKFKNLCLVLEGEDLIKAADKVIFEAYGVV